MYDMFSNSNKLETITLGEKFIIKENTDIELRNQYTKDKNGNKVGGTITQTSIIYRMFSGCKSLTNVYVADEGTKNILIDNASTVGISNTNIIKDPIN